MTTLLKPQIRDGMSRKRSIVMFISHLLVLAGAVLLMVLISIDTFRNISFVGNPTYLRIQFWICLLFMADIIIEMVTSPRHWHYLATHIFFLLISVPYINVLWWLGINISGEMAFLLRYIPMLRAAYVFAIIGGALSSNGVQTMFKGYIILLVMVLYFASMMFFVEEHKVNPEVHTYWSALWWAWMCMTTAGSYISEYTVTGKVLSVVLSAGGLILFPVFTVYITNAVTGDKATS